MFDHRSQCFQRRGVGRDWSIFLSFLSLCVHWRRGSDVTRGEETRREEKPNAALQMQLISRCAVCAGRDGIVRPKSCSTRRATPSRSTSGPSGAPSPSLPLPSLPCSHLASSAAWSSPARPGPFFCFSRQETSFLLRPVSSEAQQATATSPVFRCDLYASNSTSGGLRSGFLPFFHSICLSFFRQICTSRYIVVFFTATRLSGLVSATSRLLQQYINCYALLISYHIISYHLFSSSYLHTSGAFWPKCSPTSLSSRANTVRYLFCYDPLILPKCSALTLRDYNSCSDVHCRLPHLHLHLHPLLLRVRFSPAEISYSAINC